MQIKKYLNTPYSFPPHPSKLNFYDFLWDKFDTAFLWLIQRRLMSPKSFLFQRCRCFSESVIIHRKTWLVNAFQTQAVVLIEYIRVYMKRAKYSCSFFITLSFNLPFHFSVLIILNNEIATKYDLRFSRQWVRKSLSSGLLCRSHRPDDGGIIYS